MLLKLEVRAVRLAEIASILAKYGLANWLNDVDYDWIGRRLKSSEGEALIRRPTSERVRLALTELGTTGIKLGQMLSTRPDLTGAALSAELSKLQVATPPNPTEQIVKTIEEELGAPLEACFRSFEPAPLASASIGQVHRAVLQSGQPVVVKVMRHGIEERVESDLEILTFLADLMQKHAPGLRQYQPVATAKLFKRTLLREMDFAYEARYLAEFAENFREDPTVHFPRVYPEWSSRRVVTMEYLEGIRIADLKVLKASGADLEAFAQRGANVYLAMIFRDGFYHADPHPGNLMRLEGDRVGVLDCGMVGRIDETLGDVIEGLLFAAVGGDADELVEIVCRVGEVPPELSRTDLQAELSELLADYARQPIDRFDLGGALMRMMEIIRAYRVVLPHGFALLLKTLVMLEGVAKLLNPTFSLAELLKGYHARAGYRKFSPDKWMRSMMRTYRDWQRFLKVLPRDLTDIVSRARSGTFEVHLEHQRLEGSVDRMVQGLLTSSLFVGSAMLLSSDVPPLVWGISLVGAAGCGVSVVLAFQLLRAIRKSGRKR